MRPPIPSAPDLWAEWYRGGKSIHEIASKEDCSPSKVYRCLVRHGVRMRPCGGERSTITTRDVREWVEMYRREMSTEQIAARHGCATATVARHLKRVGVELRARGPVPTSGAKVLRLRAEGLTHGEIAERLGLESPHSASQIAYRERKRRRSNAASA